MNNERSIDKILEKAIDMHVSDLHLTVNLKPIFRHDGVLKEIDEFPVSTPERLEQYVKDVLTQENREKYVTEKFMDSSLAHAGTRFRVHVYRQMGVDALALRLIPIEIPNFNDMNLPESVRSFTTLKNGLVLVTGITGSGKSTTLASIINEINQTQSKHIVTIEDPVEFVHRHNQCMINQREVGTDVNNFPDAVKAAMREDPDILLVGELRDLETISNAITMAESGHLVFGTLHTRSASESVDRIIDVFPPEQQEQIRMQLANSIGGVVSQSLLPKVGGGRIPCVEVMIPNDAIRNLIRKPTGPNAIVDQIQSSSRKLGSQTQIQALAKLYVGGLITQETAFGGLKDAEAEALIEMIRVARRDKR